MRVRSQLFNSAWSSDQRTFCSLTAARWVVRQLLLNGAAVSQIVQDGVVLEAWRRDGVWLRRY